MSCIALYFIPRQVADFQDWRKVRRESLYFSELRKKGYTFAAALSESFRELLICAQGFRPHGWNARFARWPSSLLSRTEAFGVQNYPADGSSLLTVKSQTTANYLLLTREERKHSCLCCYGFFMFFRCFFFFFEWKCLLLSYRAAIYSLSKWCTFCGNASRAAWHVAEIYAWESIKASKSPKLVSCF